MTNFDEATLTDSASHSAGSHWRRQLASPRGALAVVLLAAVALALAPLRIVEPLRQGWQTALRPGQRVINRGVDAGQGALAWLRGAAASAEQLAEAQRTATQLTEQNRQLEAELELIRSDATTLAPVPALPDPLLLGDTVPARVLGRQAQSYLRSRDLLDAGSGAGVTSGALVTDADPATAPGATGGRIISPTSAAHPSQSHSTGGSRASGSIHVVLDAGRDMSLEPGGLVLAGRRVWGRVAAVGPYTSVVQRITEAGYRDTVQIGRVEDRRLRLGPKGLLVGTGGGMARIELVDASQPLAIGDEVYTADDGVVRTPLLYGLIVRLDRTAGESYWQIWMEPAVKGEEPHDVAVLRMELNPSRVAGRQQEAVSRRQ